MEKAIQESRAAVEAWPGVPDMIALYGHACARGGRSADAEKALAELQSLSRKRFVSSFPFAFLYVGLGRHDEAIASLEKAFEERAGRLVYLRIERAFDPLRADPRFQRMIARLNFPA